MKTLIRIVFSLLMLSLVSIWVQAQDGTSDFVEAGIDRTSAYYVSEPIIYTWRWFLATTNVDIANTRPDVRYPAFLGFGQETLDISTESAIRNGQTYQVITQQVVLYAYSEGTFTIDPLRIVIPETPFAPRQTLESAPVQITIQPLPDNAPESFGNAVGQFDLKASLDRFEGKTGNPLTLTMTITGSGNGPVLYVPQPSLGPEWRSYWGESTRRQDGPLLGEEVFTWSLIPLQPGMLTIPSQSWSSLNPQSGQYETHTTEPFTVTISGEPLVEPETISPAAEPTLYPLNTFGWTAENPRVWLELLPRPSIYPPPLPPSGIAIDAWLCGVIPPALVGIILGVKAISRRRQTQGQKQTQKRKRSSVFQDRLTALAQKSPQEIAEGVEVILRDVLRQRQRTPTQDLGSVLQDLPADLRKALQACFETAEAAPYAPFSAEDAKHLIQDVQRLISSLEVS